MLDTRSVSSISDLPAFNWHRSTVSFLDIIVGGYKSFCRDRMIGRGRFTLGKNEKLDYSNVIMFVWIIIIQC